MSGKERTGEVSRDVHRGRRSRGDPVLLRYVNDGRVSRVLPMNVVADDERATQLFIRAGTRTLTRCEPDGSPIPRSLPYAERFARPWVLCPGTWGGAHVLMLAPAGAAASMWAFWDEEWDFQGLYVNLQEPLRRTRFGFDTSDHVLDVVVEPDHSWTWKDEDELAEAIRLGRFTPQEAADVRREGERIVALLEARSWPFDRDWADWRPGPSWPQPELVAGCEVP